MAQQKKGFITRMLEGKEKSEEYARSTLPTNRWQLFWDIFKGNFGKMVKINLLTVIFFVPLFAVLILCSLVSEAGGQIYPFGSNVGIGYPAFPALKGQAEALRLQNDFVLYLGILITSVIAAVGLSGGMYVMRNMVWTEGIFVTNDFWRGVKLNFKNALQTALLFSGVLFACGMMLDASALALATSVSKTQRVLLYISQGTSWAIIVFALMISLWMIALGVNYEMKFFTLLRNAAVLSFGTLPQTVFFGILALWPFALLMVGQTFIIVIATMLTLFLSFSYALLVWLDFAQWVFDKFINPKIKGAKVGRGIYGKNGEVATSEDSAASMEYQRAILAHGRSRLVARPIKPIDDSVQVYELPQSFTRDDLKKLRESKQNIVEDSEAYAEEHKNDLRYVEYNRQFDEREKAVAEEDAKKNKKNKKFKPPKATDED